MGWVPKEEFRGPESQWRDAEDFVERGKNVLPIVNSLLKKEREKTSKLETKIENLRADWGDKLSRLESMSAKAIQQTEARIRAEYEARKEAAVERGDMDAYRAADKAEKTALADLDTKREEPVKPKSDVPPAWQEAIADWVGENEWFQTDAEMAAVAGAEHTRLREAQPGLTPSENLAKVREYVKGKYPDKFGIEPRRSGSRVEGGSRTLGNSNSAYGKLPAEAKQVCNSSDMGWKLYLKPGEDPDKNETIAKERWAREYWSQPGVSQ